jgi:hypothetical protein
LRTLWSGHCVIRIREALVPEPVPLRGSLPSVRFRNIGTIGPMPRDSNIGASGSCNRSATEIPARSGDERESYRAEAGRSWVASGLDGHLGARRYWRPETCFPLVRYPWGIITGVLCAPASGSRGRVWLNQHLVDLLVRAGEQTWGGPSLAASCECVHGTRTRGSLMRTKSYLADTLRSERRT